MNEDGDPIRLNERLRERNHALAKALRRAGEELAKTKAQLEQLTRPPLSFAVMIRLDRFVTDDHGVQHASAEVLASNRRLIVPVAASVNAARLSAGMTVLLDENMALVGVAAAERCGQVRQVSEPLDDGRLIVSDSSGALQVVERAHDLRHARLTGADRVMVDAGGRFALAVLPRERTDDLVLEESPDVFFEDIGGLDAQIAAIRDAVQLPFAHRDLFERFDLNPPKGVLLYGPPGNGKTLIAKAVASSLARGAGREGVFLSVKGPELLNKYVGESERLIRLVFDRARERASDGRPVIVFIDEMDALLRTRGTGVSSDVETTIVPQFLAELDGVERLDNVIVIGASNRVDMIDPAVLRPGRLDVKIRVDRPDRAHARMIAARYLTRRLPYEDGWDARSLCDLLVEDVYDGGRLLAEVRDERGAWSPLAFSHIASGAMLRNIVDRAKTKAVKESVRSGAPVAIGPRFVREAVEDEFESSASTLVESDPVQWAKVNGMEAGRVTALRPVAGRRSGAEEKEGERA